MNPELTQPIRTPSFIFHFTENLKDLKYLRKKMGSFNLKQNYFFTIFAVNEEDCECFLEIPLNPRATLEATLFSYLEEHIAYTLLMRKLNKKKIPDSFEQFMERIEKMKKNPFYTYQQEISSPFFMKPKRKSYAPENLALALKYENHIKTIFPNLETYCFFIPYTILPKIRSPLGHFNFSSVKQEFEAGFITYFPKFRAGTTEYKVT